MLRVGDLERSIDFYTKVLGMTLQRRSENPEYKYSLAFVGYGGNPEHAEIELTYNWGVDKYELGTAYGHIALGVPDVAASCEKIKAAGGKIVGREYTTDRPQYITPDVYIHKVGDQYFVQVNDDGLPKLKISNYYLETLKRKDTKDKDKDKAAKEYVQERLRSARWLIDSIQQRQRTIVRVTESILHFQRDFFEKGISHLKPLILRDVANHIGMHESTISRATSNKYVHTPQGLFELKYFFNAGINREDGGEDIASEAVKRLIKQIVGGEEPKRPYSDQKLVELLRQQHKIDIARRTVAKYREQLGILPSAQRKQVF